MQLDDEGGLVRTRRTYQDFTETTLESAAPVLPSPEDAMTEDEDDLDRDTIPSPPPFL